MEPERKKLKTLIDSDDFLKVLGVELAKVDNVLISVLSKRMDLAKLVQEWKARHGKQPILRLETEDARIAQFAQWAGAKGLNQNFARAILYSIIAESCRVQIGQLQSISAEEAIYDENREKWYQLLKNNLLALTAQVASEYDVMYEDNAPFATKSYLEFEGYVIETEINALKATGNTGIAIDIGCATGRVAFQSSPDFEKVIGYDISPDMIKVAKSKCDINGASNAEFIETDIENGIPLDNNSVSLAVMNLGTASDIRDIRKVLSEIKRVLKEDGRFVLSFYNTGAIFYRNFIPWSVSLTAEIDSVKHFLSVHRNEKTFNIFARSFTTREVRNLLEKERLTISSVLTHPAVASILPDGFFAEKELKDTIAKIDKKLAVLDDGAYIIATGRKNS